MGGFCLAIMLVNVGLEKEFESKKTVRNEHKSR